MIILISDIGEIPSFKKVQSFLSKVDRITCRQHEKFTPLLLSSNFILIMIFFAENVLIELTHNL